MQPIPAIEYGSALAVLGLGIAYLSLCLIRARYYPEDSFSRVRPSLLKAALLIYPLVSAALITAFFITRQNPSTQLPSHVLFYTWELINGLCLGAEITYFWLFTLPLSGVWKFAVVTCACLLIVAVLVVGLWCYVATQRQWLWIFIPLLSGALTLTGFCFTNDAAPIHARYRRHWGYLTLLVLLGIGLGLVAGIVPAEKLPNLQQVHYASQSLIGLLVLYSIQVGAVVSAYRSKIQAKKISQAPRRDERPPEQGGQPRESLVTKRMGLDEAFSDVSSYASLESLLMEEYTVGPERSEGCKQRPDSETLSQIV